jgi:hypothetical protein
MPAATMVISPSTTSSISCLNCAILCKLPHRHVNHTEPQKGTLHTNCKIRGKAFSWVLQFGEGAQTILEQVDCRRWLDQYNIHDQYDIPTNLKFVAADLNRAIGRHPKFGSIDTIGDTNDVLGLYKATLKEEVSPARESG